MQAIKKNPIDMTKITSIAVEVKQPTLRTIHYKMLTVPRELYRSKMNFPIMKYASNIIRQYDICDEEVDWVYGVD